ncbi:hypothetical protein FZC76_18085 [Sutcliffiella horikoshii]|uniref:Uncharacterized protein n=1 Tax=Sutcliffiella horikoshii TaxID=79883 RepID=A0A5D4SQR7_9BACI|nr:hypothetical protein [Sutcliffiella horikoshii]TYS64472.1 hypothetical protein FZC76_18085 [Sutcliffiella horikoshii]
MKLVLYNDENRVLDIQEDIQQVVTGEDEISWQHGAIKGIKTNFIVLPDEVEVGETVTEIIINQDVKNNFKKRDLEKENADLLARLENTETAIIALLDLV